MTSDPFIRRARDARRQKEIVDLVYQIVWNKKEQVYQVRRAGEFTGSCSRDKRIAIGLAIQQSQIETKQGLKVAVHSTNHGTQITEWSSSEQSVKFRVDPAQSGLGSTALGSRPEGPLANDPLLLE